MDLDKLISDQRARRADLLTRERFVLDDQWDDGRGWVGPLPADDGRDLGTDLIRAKFAQRNVLKEVTTRHRDAVIGREPAWDLTSDGRGQVKLRQEAVDALVNWWDETEVLTVLQTAVLRLLFAQEVSRGREELRGCVAPLRLFIKAASVVDGRVPKRASLAEALGDLSVHAASPTVAGVLRNADGDPIATRYEYVGEDGSRRVEVTGTGTNLAALGLDVEETDDTLVAIVNGNTVDGDVTRLPIGGRMLMFELQREAFLTPASISQQKLINKAWTMLSHNLDVAGFTERVFLNAQTPGHWVDAAGEAVGPGEGRFVPDELLVGAGVSNYVQGIPITDSSGGMSMTSPSVAFRDPVPPEAFTKSIDAAYAAVLQESKQLHVLLSGDAVASGLSRRQATADYVDSLGLTASQAQAAIRWLLGTTLATASVLMGAPGRYVALRPTAKARISVIQPTAEDINATIAKRDAGFISRETGMTEVGVEDPDAELDRINAEAAENPVENPEPVVEPAE